MYTLSVPIRMSAMTLLEAAVASPPELVVDVVLLRSLGVSTSAAVGVELRGTRCPPSQCEPSDTAFRS